MYPGGKAGFSVADQFFWRVDLDVGITPHHLGFCTASRWSAATRIFDLTGDSIPDLVFSDPELITLDVVWEPNTGQSPHDFAWLVMPGVHDEGGWRFSSDYITWFAPIAANQIRETEGKDGSEINSFGAGTADTRDLIDMNADGLLDLVIAGPEGSHFWTVYYNSGDDFGPATVFEVEIGEALRYVEAPEHLEDQFEQVVGLFDINGDGLVDQVIVDRENLSWDVYLHEGHRLHPLPKVWDNVVVASPNFPNCNNRKEITSVNPSGKAVREFFDINGDGLPDIVDKDTCTDPPSGISLWGVKLNSGTSFSEIRYLWQSPSQWIRDPPAKDTFDINGDGLVDFIDFSNSSNGYDIHPSVGGAWCASANGTDCAASGTMIAPNPNASRPYLLKTVENGLGGKTIFEYRPSTDGAHVDEEGVPQLPFNVWTVSAIARQDEQCTGGVCPGHERRTEFLYDHGLFDHGSREFRGFGTVEQRDRADNTKQVFFHQDSARKGKTRVVAEFADCSPSLEECDKPITTRGQFWQCASLQDGAPLPSCPEPLTSRVWVRLGSSIGFVHSEYSPALYKLEYSGTTAWHQCGGKFYGNAQGSEVWDTGGGGIRKIKTHTEYQCIDNTLAYIVDKPTRVRTFENSITLQEKWFTYDEDAAPGSAPRGNVTTVASWVDQPQTVIGTLQPCPGGGGQCVTTTTFRDALGNVTKVTDANANDTTTTYDPATLTYPFEITNAKGQAVSTWHDPLCGREIAKTVPYAAGGDPNAQPKSQRSFDAFCRLKRTARPDESLASSPAAAYCYALGGEVGLTARILTKQPNFDCPTCVAPSEAVFENCNDPNAPLAEGYEFVKKSSRLPEMC